jgi:hypothetical protein
MRPLIFSIIFSAAAFAQIGGPFLGYVPQGTQLRPVYGLPAAGAIGSVIASRDFSHMALPPQQYFAVVSAADTGEVLIASEVSAGGFNLTPISGAAANPDILAISPGGTSAVLWFPSSNHLQAVSGLPNSPSLRDIDASFLNSSPLSIAVSDDGQWAAGLWSAGVYAFGPNNQVIPLQTDPGVVALAFFHNNHNLALATSTRATSITDVGGATQGPSLLFDYSTQSLSPRAIALSFDNQHAVVADASGMLVNISVASGSANTVDCKCSPTGLYSQGDAVFRLNGTGAPQRGAPNPELKLFDAAAGSVLIVPPALSVAGGRQ